MIKTTLYFTRTGKGRAHDDVIQISENSESRELFDIRFTTPELRKSKTFTMTESRTIDYVADILRSLSRDGDPFENVQVTTAIHPIIFYHVLDMDELGVRSTVLDMVQTALRADVRLA